MQEMFNVPMIDKNTREQFDAVLCVLFDHSVPRTLTVTIECSELEYFEEITEEVSTVIANIQTQKSHNPHAKIIIDMNFPSSVITVDLVHGTLEVHISTAFVTALLMEIKETLEVKQEVFNKQVEGVETVDDIMKHWENE